MDINKNIKRTGYITKNHESFLYPALHKVSNAQVTQAKNIKNTPIY